MTEVYKSDQLTVYVYKTDEDITNMIDIISDEFESNFITLNEMFQVDKPQAATIYIYTNKEQFKQVIGRDTEGTYDASDKIIKVYTPANLRLDHVRQEYTFQVIHEYIHAIIQQINNDVGHIKWLDEGIAYYATGQLEIDIASQRYDKIQLPDLTMFEESQRYFEQYGGRAYYFSGLIIKYIDETYGTDVLNEIILNPKNMEHILQTSFEEFYEDWTIYVNNLLK